MPLTADVKINPSVITAGKVLEVSSEEIEESRFFDSLEIPTDVEEQASQAPGWMDAKLDRILERMKAIDDEVIQNDAARGARIAMIEDHFAGENYALERRRDYLEDQVRRIAFGYPFPGGKKSRRLAFGSFGFRKIAEKMKIGDRNKAEGYAEKHCPSAIEDVPATTKLVAKILTDSVLAQLHETGEVPDQDETGLEYIEADERGTFFVKTGT